VGLIRFTARNEIEEDGVLPGDDYREIWSRFEETGDDDFTALVSVLDSEKRNVLQRGYVMRVGNLFAFTINRPADEEERFEPEIRSLFTQPSEQPPPQPSDDILHHLKKYITVIGQCDDWMITHSLDPDLIGHSICPSKCQHVALTALLGSVDWQIVTGVLPDQFRA
jgi:hypothetical protein